METADMEMILSLVEQDQELAGLWAKHQELEKALDEMNQRIYLSSEEQIERKQLQKRKLAGRDRIEQILAAHRSQEQ
jgi:uncharacterized protein